MVRGGILMNIVSVTRNKDYGAWTVKFVHEGVEQIVVVKIQDKKLVFDCATELPAFMLDLIRNNLALRGEVSRGFLNESYCKVPEANW